MFTILVMRDIFNLNSLLPKEGFQWNYLTRGGPSIYTRRQQEKVTDYMKLSNLAILGMDFILEAENK